MINQQEGLPEGWVAIFDKTYNTVYYYNQQFNHSQWERPIQEPLSSSRTPSPPPLPSLSRTPTPPPSTPSPPPSPPPPHLLTPKPPQMPSQSTRTLLMNLYLNVIFKTLLLNNILKQKHDQLKISNKPAAYVPLQIEERFILTFDRPEIYTLRNYNFPKTHFNDTDVINKLNTMLETKIKSTFAGMGGAFSKNKFLNEFMNDVNNLKNIKNKKTIKKKIDQIKMKDRHELENKINAKIKKYIKNYLKKKEKQLEILEMQIINAKKKLHTPSSLSLLQFNQKEHKNVIKNHLNSKINKKINKFKVNNINENDNKNKKNTSRKKYD